MSNNGALHQEVTRIPDMDGTGPRWLGNRTFSRRGRWSYADYTPLPVFLNQKQDGDQLSGQKPAYGIGRGGLPHICLRKMRRRWNSFIQVYNS